MSGRRSDPRHTRETRTAERVSDTIDDDDAPTRTEAATAEWERLIGGCGVTLVVSNRAYNELWLLDMKESNPDQHMMITAILCAIRDNAGGLLSHHDVIKQSDAVARHVIETRLQVVPSNGVELEHNGEGIGHAKYSVSKSVALLWANINDTIYVTFDDHKPVPYHRGIKCLRDLRLGKTTRPTNNRTPRRIIEKIENSRERKSRGWNPRDKYYK